MNFKATSTLCRIASLQMRTTSCFQCHSRKKSTVIDGRMMFENVLNDLKEDIGKWLEKGKRPPRLTALTAGYDPSSMSYVKIKKKAAHFVGIRCDIVELTSGHNDEDVVRIINRLNRADDVDGILVQLPLYPHNNERVVCDAVLHSKDVDGTSTMSLGNLCHNKDHFVPCTALAVHHILNNIRGFDFYGKHAVVVGRSKHVGLPIAMLLHSSESQGNIEGLNMSTTILHRHTPPKALSQLCESADVLVSAAGVPGLIKSEMVKPGAIVLDVGITKVKDPETGKHAFKGDIDFENVKNKAMYLTTVPGGVGPVTVGMLMRNVFKAAQLKEAELERNKEQENQTSEVDNYKHQS